MAGKGPAPKRSDQRRRRNKEGGEVEKLHVIAEEVVRPEPNESWHYIALNWYNSLADSGQSIYYEPSDWQTAYITAELISAEFYDHMDGRKIRPTMIAEVRALMTELLTTEAERRRVRLEVERAQRQDNTEAEVVSIMKKYKDLG